MKKTVLNIPPSHLEYAKTLGASYDKTTKSWCVLGDIPTELLSYIQSEPRRRDYVAERIPSCPICGCGMVLRQGEGYEPFWGCANYPRCKRKLQLDEFQIESPHLASDFYQDAASNALSSSDQPRQEGLTEIRKEAQRLVVLAINLLGGEPAATRWFNKEKITLKGKRPIDIISTIEGCAAVEKLLHETVN